MKIAEGLNTLLRHERSFSSFKDSLKQRFSLDIMAQTDTRTDRFIQKFAKRVSLTDFDYRFAHTSEYLVKPDNLLNNYLN